MLALLLRNHPSTTTTEREVSSNILKIKTISQNHRNRYREQVSNSKMYPKSQTNIKFRFKKGFNRRLLDFLQISQSRFLFKQLCYQKQRQWGRERKKNNNNGNNVCRLFKKSPIISAFLALSYAAYQCSTVYSFMTLVQPSNLND